MQGLHTHTAMKHADLSLAMVWDHFMNMGGCVERLEVDAYLHGLLALPADDGDCVTQAVNELLDDRAMTGPLACCRAPYSPSRRGAGFPDHSLIPVCRRGAVRPGAETPLHDLARPDLVVPEPPVFTSRRAPRQALLQPVRRAVRRDR